MPRLQGLSLATISFLLKVQATYTEVILSYFLFKK